MTEVYLIESERGWGKKTLDTLEFEEPNVAEAFVRGYNSLHNPANKPTPDYYIWARLEGQPQFGMLR